MNKERGQLLQIKNVGKRFGAGIWAVQGIDTVIYDREVFALLGASGCGKTTLLRMIAGLEKPTNGNIILDGDEITYLEPYDREVNMMFQSYALFPHLTVEKNIAFGLHQEKMSRKKIKVRVDEMLTLVQLEEFAGRKPHQLSGGQKQRVALARSLAKHPKLLLLDEPMAALDKRLREYMQLELVKIIRQAQVACVIVTHDQEEAMNMADRIAVMEGGKILQVDTPRGLYEHPKTRSIASFVGSVNLIEGILEVDAQDHAIVKNKNIPNAFRLNHAITSVIQGGKVLLGVRPEKIQITDQKPKNIRSENLMEGKISTISYLGGQSIYHVENDKGFVFKVLETNESRHAERYTLDEAVYLSWSPDNLIVLFEQ